MESKGASKTPGYNCRLTIKFSADKNGKPLAHYWSQDLPVSIARTAPGVVGSGRWIRLSTDVARLFVAQEQADQS